MSTTVPNAAPQQQTQPPLLPTLSALLPISTFQRTRSNISLLSIHSEYWEVWDKIYYSSDSILPSQRRLLRLRILNSNIKETETRKGGGGKGIGGDKEDVRVQGAGDGAGVDKGQGMEQGISEGKSKSKGKRKIGAMSLTYVSRSLSGKEYDEINVRGVVEVDIGGLSLLEDVEDFLQTLGFSYSHEYTKRGILFHLPLPHPSLTLHLTLSRLIFPKDSTSQLYSISKSDTDNTLTTQEPFLVELYPARPVLGVPTRGDLSLSEVVGLMKGVAGRIDGLEWGTGRV